MASASRTVILALAGVLTPLAASAQGASQLRGMVVNDSGVPIKGATVTLARLGYVIRTDSMGAFALSGSPGSTLVFTVAAAGYRTDSAVVTFPRRSGLSREFRLVSESTAPAEPNPSDRVLRGRVMDAEGGALAYASVQVNGGRRYLSDDSGRFTIPPPAGRFSLLVRRIGFSPEEVVFNAAPDTAIRVRMTALASALPEQRVTGRAAFVSLDLNGFYRRMKDAERGINHGYFITPEDLEARKPHLISQMAEGYPAVFVRHNILDPRRDILVGQQCPVRPVPTKDCIPVGTLFRCVMTVFLDGIRITAKLGTTPDDYLNELVVPGQVAAMEIYPRGNGAPPQYQPHSGQCGVVLIWSK